MEDFDGVFFGDVGFGKALVVIKVNEVGRSVVLASLAALWAVPGKVSYFSTLETGV